MGLIRHSAGTSQEEEKEEEEGRLAFPNFLGAVKPRLPANRLRLQHPPAETICHVSHQIKPLETTAFPEADGCQTPKEKRKKPGWPVSAPRAYKTSAPFISEPHRYNTACSCAALPVRQTSTISIIKRNLVFKSPLCAEAPHSQEPHVPHPASHSS